MKKADALIEPLTRREQEILELLVNHCSNKEIASRKLADFKRKGVSWGLRIATR